MGNKNKAGSIVIVIGYVLLAIIISFVFLRNPFAGMSNFTIYSTAGSSAKIENGSTIDISQYRDVRKGDKIYLSLSDDNKLVISSQNSASAKAVLVKDITGNHAKIEYYPEGLRFFQIILFIMLLVIPVVILAKNDKLEDVLGSLGGIPEVLAGLASNIGKGGTSGGGSKLKKSKTKYGDQGTARIGNLRELNGLTGTDGFTISKNVRLSAEKSYEHVMVLGPTGSGKSSSFFIPNLLDLDGIHSAVVTDPKGEMYELTSPYLESLGYNIVKLEPLHPERNEFFYNPLAIIDDATEIRNIAQLILTNGNKAVEISTGSSSSGAEWINMSIPLLAASFAYVKEFGKTKSIPEAIDIILNGNLKSMDEMFRKCPDAYKLFLIFKSAGESEKTISSIKSVLTTNVQLFTDPKVAKFVTAPMVYNEDGEKIPDEERLFNPLILRKKPTVLFVCVPEAKATMMMPLMSVFFTQLLEITMEQKTGQPILYMLDEFANIGVIPSIATVTATARSRKIGISIGIQGVEQLKRNYGDENAEDIMNNLKTKMIYSGLTGTSAQYVSDLAGVTTIETKSYSTQNTPGQDVVTSIFTGPSVQKSGTRREVITPDEVRRMDEDKVLIIAHNRNPVFDAKNSYFKQKKYTEKI